MSELDLPRITVKRMCGVYTNLCMISRDLKRLVGVKYIAGQGSWFCVEFTRIYIAFTSQRAVSMYVAKPSQSIDNAKVDAFFKVIVYNMLFIMIQTSTES